MCIRDSFNREGDQVALEGARESIVLLKNEGALLPLDRGRIKSIAVIGPDAYPPVSTGGGSARVQPFKAVSFLEGIANSVPPSVPVYYDSGVPSLSEMAEATTFSVAPQNGAVGLQAEYFANPDFQGIPYLARVEKNVNFGPPGKKTLPDQSLSARWTGYYLSLIHISVPTAAEQALGPAGIVAADPDIPAGTPVDPIAANLFKLYPSPNTGAAGALVNNFVFDPNKTQFSNAFDARVDHRFNENNLLFARFTSNNVSSVIPTNLPSVTVNNVLINPGNGQFGFAGPAKDIAYNAQLNYTHVFSPALLLELKAAYTLIDNTSNSPNSGTNAATAVGFPNNINFGPLDSSGLPLINMSGTAPLGDSNFVPIVDVSNTFEENGAISYTRGSHSIKAGVEVIRRQARNVQSSNGVGNINFGLPEDSGATPQDAINNLATFLVGAFTGEGRNTDLETPNYRSWETGFYAQDTWKVRPWLTVNYGARYDIFTPFTEVHGFLSNFDPATNQLLVPAAGLKFLTAEGADTTGIVASSATAGLKTTYSNIGPRVGFAATVARGTVLRGGFGIAYFPGNYTSNASLKNAPFNGIYSPSIGGTSCQSPLASQIEINATGTAALPSCQAGLGQTTTLGGATGGLPVPVPQALNSADLSLPDNVALNFRTSYVEQFNLMLQKQFCLLYTSQR